MTRDLHLPRERDLPPGRFQRRKELLVNELAAAPPAVRTRLPRRAVLALAASLLLLATGFGAYALTRDDPTHVDSIGCYAAAGLDSDLTVIGNTAQDPVAACAELWRKGDIGPAPASPSLQACVLDTGAVAVLPADDPGVCNALGIARLSDQARAEFRRLGGLAAALRERLGTASGSSLPRTPCPTEAEARRIARDVLDARGLRSWSVEASGSFTVSDCPSPTVDRARETVVLVGAP